MKVFRSVFGRAGSVLRYTTSALQPMLWLCLVISPASLFLASITNNATLMTVLLYFAGAPIVSTILAYFFFCFTNPSKLQSESYQLRTQTLDLLESQGGGVVTDPDLLEIIITPELPKQALDKEAKNE